MRLRGVTSVALSEENRLVLGHRPLKRPVAAPASSTAMPSSFQREETLRRFQQAQQQPPPQQTPLTQQTPPPFSPSRRRVVEKKAYPAAPDVSQTSWEELASACRACGSCAGCEQKQGRIFETGCRQAPLMVIGDWVRNTVDEHGAVVESDVDALLWKMIRAMGRDPASTDPATSVYVANASKCCGMSDSLAGKAVEACRGYLLRQIALVRPRVILVFGGNALKALFGGGSISTEHGKWREFQGIPVMPTYHPSYVLRLASNPSQVVSLKRQVWEDLKLVMAKLKEVQS